MRNIELFTKEDAYFLWRISGRIEGVIEMMGIFYPGDENAERIKRSLLKTQKALMEYVDKKIGEQENED